MSDPLIKRSARALRREIVRLEGVIADMEAQLEAARATNRNLEDVVQSYRALVKDA